MEDYYEYLDSNGVTTLYKLIKDDTVALIDSYSVTINGITTTLDTHINNSDIHTPIADIENMVDTKIAGLVNSAPETLDTLKELSDALGNDTNFATTIANQIGNKASKDDVYTKEETDTLLEGKANSVHNHVVNDITDFPTIPTKTSELINDSGFLTSSSGLITSVSWSDITNKPNFSTVATSGSYTDLSNTPTIPTKVSQLENDMGFGTGGDTSDCVHKTGNEIIAGIKTFTNGTWVTNNSTTSGYSIKNTALARNEVPSQLYHATFRAYDKNDKILGEYCVEKSTTGCTLLNMNVRSEDSNGNQLSESLYLNMSNDGSAVRFYPSSNNKVDLGMSNHKWEKIYSDDVVHTSGDETIAGTKTFTSMLKIAQGTLQVGSDAGYSVTYDWKGSIVSKQPSGTYNISLPNANGTLAIDENLVHRTGNEDISGNKVFRDTIFRKSDITTSTVDVAYRFEDSNNSPCGYIQNNIHYWQNDLHNRYIAYNNTSGKEIYLDIISSNDGLGCLLVSGTAFNRNLFDATSETGHTAIATMGWVNNPATSTNVVHRSGDETIAGNKTFLSGYATTPATSDYSTRIATTAWVINYVNSVRSYSMRSNAMGSNAVNSVAGSNAVGSSIAAYYSNATTLTAEGSSSSSGSSYPSDYSDYIDISPKVGTIYTGSQLFSSLTPTASGTIKKSYTDSGTPIYYTTAKATATFSGAFEASAKYQCTTANAVKFRAYVDLGTPGSMGAASVIDNSSARSIFIRVQ